MLDVLKMWEITIFSSLKHFKGGSHLHIYTGNKKRFGHEKTLLGLEHALHRYFIMNTLLVPGWTPFFTAQIQGGESSEILVRVDITQLL